MSRSASQACYASGIADQPGRFFARDTLPRIKHLRRKEKENSGLQTVAKVVYNQSIVVTPASIRPATLLTTHKKEDCGER
jgi:hypothetical protein